MFYHIKNLQSTKTFVKVFHGWIGFITLRIYKVLKQFATLYDEGMSFITLRIYKVLKQKNNSWHCTLVLSH